jgi:hypothetical protein
MQCHRVIERGNVHRPIRPMLILSSCVLLDRTG